MSNDDLLEQIASSDDKSWAEYIWDGFTSWLGEIAGSGASFILDNITSAFGYIADWLYDLLFVQIYPSCQNFGSKFFSFFFDKFCSQSFSWCAIEYFCGFCFLLFALKFTINIIRG